MPTHQDIIKQQVERFRAEMLKAGFKPNLWFEQFLTNAMHVAAQATEKAGEVKVKIIHERMDRDEEGVCIGWNDACTKSRRQLDKHFGRES